MDEADDVVLEADGVSHSYGDFDVLDDVSTRFRRGEVAALVGQNGSGKTTCLRILAGLMQPDRGEVTLDVGDTVPRKVGYLPQEPRFRAGFTAAETLEIYTDLLPDLHDGEGYVESALEQVGILDAAEREVTALSGGMTRLLGVAQARTGRPALTVLDEPTSGLDPGTTGRIFRTLNQVAEQGSSVVLTSHDLEMVERYADSVHLLANGSIEERGSPEELMERYDTEALSEVFDAVVGDGGSRGDTP